MNIYAKLTFLCLFLVVLSTAIIFVITNIRIEKAYKDELLISVTKQAETTITNIEQFIFSRVNDVRMATKNPYFRISDISEEELTSRLQELENLNDLYHSFSYFDTTGIRIADSQKQSIGETSEDSYFPKVTTETPSLMEVKLSKQTARPVMEFASLVTDYYTEAPSGVLVGRVLVDELFSIMGNISLSNDSTRKLEVNLISQDGNILYSNQEIADPSNSPFEHFDMLKFLDGERVNILETEEKLFFVAKQQSYLNYAGNDWILAVSISKDIAFSPISEIRREILIVILSVLAFSIIIGLVAARFFVKPIVNLSKSAEEIGKGNFDVEIEVSTNDEIGKLAQQLANSTQIVRKRFEEQAAANAELEAKNTEIETQKKQLENINKQIADSIQYAQRIQNSILPDLKSISKVVKDAFVIYKPKDVVSGDFYWFERIRQGRNEYLVIACADCTGHGVPGAIMSIMGSNQLTNTVYYQNYLDPNKILARMDKLIKMELSRDTDEQNRDGMEIGICVINLDDLKMEFTGAGIPLYHISEGEMNTYRSPKLMIGGIEGDEREAASKLGKEEIQLKSGDRLYMASDGYQDQFGGPDDRKFMVKNFKALINETVNQDLQEQSILLEKAFDQWKGEGFQTDDVLVIGVEI